MSALFGERVTLGQADGSEVELFVWGDEHYANYETPSGHAAVYDDDLGLFCYARLVSGAFESTRTPVSGPVPAGIEMHGRESDEVRVAKAAESESKRASRRQGGSRGPIKESEGTQ